VAVEAMEKMDKKKRAWSGNREICTDFANPANIAIASH
jgi:hypothetical protein